ncbi:MAG: hypothetical protein AAF996_02005 [Pseudomonadota bacterium]
MNLLGKSAIAATLAVGLMAPAMAQELRTASESVVACQTVEDALERLDCFEKAATELSAALAVPVPAPVVAEAAPTPTVPVAPTEQAAATAAPTTVAATQAPAAVQQASAETATADREAPSRSLPGWIPRISFGSDRDVEKEPDEFETTITRIQVNRLGRHFFTTAEGHVWKQRDIGKIRAPKNLPAEVILSQNIMGGIQLKIKETNRIYSVARVE